MRTQGAVAAALALALVPGSASGAWSAGGSGSNRATAAVLAGPTALTATWNPTVRLSWPASASSWAGGYRVQRSIAPGGPFANVLTTTATTADDSPGAGTHYYRVVTEKAGWSSAPSPVFARADATYGVAATSAYTATNCPGGTARVDLQQGHVPTSTAGQSLPLGSGTTAALCSDTFTTGQAQPAGTTRLVLYTSNTTNSKDCPLTVAIARNGTTALGSAAATILAGQSTSNPLTVDVPTAAVASFTTGDRITAVLTPGASCNGTTLFAAGSQVPSRLVLP